MGIRTSILWVVVAAFLLAACGPQGGDREPAPSSDEKEDVPSALTNPSDPSFPDPLIDLDQLKSGGPPPDGIPAIDDPNFEEVGEVDWLDDNEPVMSLTVGEETRAYPLQVMTWHEIVNDVVDGTPVTVTYCPLCNSGVAFEREIDGRLLDFGTSGMLYVDNLVMYDRQTESLWPQLTGQASVGHLTGTQLKAIPMGVVGWKQFRSAHPDALVLNRDTGFDRSYGSNPYVGYDDPDGPLLFGSSDDVDGRLAPKERVIGIEVGDTAVAVRRSDVADAGVMELAVAGVDLVLWHLPGQASALDDREIAAGDDIGSVAVYRASLGGEVLSFTRDGEVFVDAGTGSKWDVLGRAVSGPLKGERLTKQIFLDTFWFAWVGFEPETKLHE